MWMSSSPTWFMKNKFTLVQSKDSDVLRLEFIQRGAARASEVLVAFAEIPWPKLATYTIHAVRGGGGRGKLCDGQATHALTDGRSTRSLTLTHVLARPRLHAHSLSLTLADAQGETHYVKIIPSEPYEQAMHAAGKIITDDCAVAIRFR